jgi:putative PIN family toxin of toxin-antitoxin system
MLLEKKEKVNRPLRVVIDTNIFISFLITNNYTNLFELVQSGNIKFIFSEELLNELLEVMNRPKLKKYFTKFQMTSLVNSINNYAEYIDVITKPEVCRDPNDNFLLGLCKDGLADYLITGDQDLLILQKFENTRIIKITELIIE